MIQWEAYQTNVCLRSWLLNREQEIVAAAATVFKEKGYHQATIEDIARAVGMLKGSLYYYIKSKQELLYKVLSAPSRTATERLEEIRYADLPAREKIRQAIHALVTHYDSNYPDIFVFLGEQLHHMPEELRQETGKAQGYYERLWREIIQEGVASGEFRPDLDPKIVSFAMLGMCGWMHRWYAKDGQFSAEEIAKMFSAIVLDGIVRQGEDAHQ